MFNKLIVTLFASFTLIATSGASNLAQLNASGEEISVANEGNGFALLNKSFGVNESFVYSGDLYFNDGQAGGIAFGSQETNHYYVLNMDRYENRVKLLYFSYIAGSYSDVVIREDYFIGNDKMNEKENNIVSPSVRNRINFVNLKVILTREDEHAYAEFYIEGIKRFGVDSTLDLNNCGTSFVYEGGYIGVNCFNSSVTLRNIEYGHSDYSYYSEPYRNQYHFQPFSRWSNDPNGLCYYNGWYHLFYQCHPFGQYWGDMYWGHARSRDLIHFEMLPLCLFPETESEFGPGDGFMWSGCVITYHAGMISDIDDLNWFPNGGGNGIISIFTRAGGLQDQVIMSSDDEGLTWTKRIRIPQNITGHNEFIDLRDPKVFPVIKDEFGKVTLWGMTLSSYNLNTGWFLKSSNLLNWQLAGSFAFPTPECIGVGVLKDESNVEHAYLTNKSRTYILGSLQYNYISGNIEFHDERGNDISSYSLDKMPLKQLDFGPDSYASQSFYIDDPMSEYFGKDIVINWYSGDLNAPYCTGPGEYANLRGRWNGGFTMPVEYGIKTTSQGLLLSQKPISVDNINLTKSNVVNITNQEINSESANPLTPVDTRTFELNASIKTNDNSDIVFKVDLSSEEYMEFGWNKNDGYYVDRTYLDDKGINTNSDWHKKYASHIYGDSDIKTFYVLNDANGLEVFANDYSVPFYFVTTAAPFSKKASLSVASGLINKLEVNEISSIYDRKNPGEEGKLYLITNHVDLDTSFLSSKFVGAYYTGNLPLTWETIENDGVVETQTSNDGISLRVLKEGDASFRVSVASFSETITVKVYESHFESELTFLKENIVTGTWIVGNDEIIGEKTSGNAFIFAEQSGDDFSYTGHFSILSGVAAALVFRASKDMTSYIVANYDSGERIVKLWSTNGEIARSGVIDGIDLNDITLTVKAVEKEVNVILNNIGAINCILDNNEPLSGYYGLNVFAGKASFKSFEIKKEKYEYSGGELKVDLLSNQFVQELYNVTLSNVRLEPGYYYQEHQYLVIKETYFREMLKENGTYKFRAVTPTFSISFKVDVTLPSEPFVIKDITVEKGADVTIFIAKLDVSSVKVNDTLLTSDQYKVKDYKLIINKDVFIIGENNVVINDSISFKVNVKEIDKIITHDETNYLPLIISLSVSGGVLLIGGGVLAAILIIKKKKGKISK